MSDPAVEIAREIAKEYAERTNDKIETYFERTNSAIQTMAASVNDMAKTVKESSEQLARYEERQTANNERMERLEQSQREQGIMQRNFEREVDDRIDKIHNEVKDNTMLRKAFLWLAGIVIASMIGGGMLFGSITGKAPANEKPNTTQKTPK